MRLRICVLLFCLKFCDSFESCQVRIRLIGSKLSKDPKDSPSTCPRQFRRRHSAASSARKQPQLCMKFSSSTEQNDSESHFDFAQMRSLEKRLAAIERSSPATLFGFYEPHLSSFSVIPGSSRVSVTSTCFVLQAILASSEDDDSLYDSLVVPMAMSGDDETTTRRQDATRQQQQEVVVSMRKVLQALLLGEWRPDDLFQVPLLLYTAMLVDPDRLLLGSNDETIKARIRQLLEAVFAARPKRRNGSTHTYSDYILFQTCRVLGMLYDTTAVPVLLDSEGVEAASSFSLMEEQSTEYSGGIGGLPADAVSEGAAAELSLSLSRCAEVSMNELCRQLAYRGAGDSTAFDVMRLAYNLLTYVVSTTSLSGTAGRELIPGQGPSPGTRTPPANRRLVVAALDAFFDDQLENGLWEKGQPIYKSFRRTGRNVGNAFVFALDTVGTLLKELPADMFRPHLQSLERTLSWIETHQLVEVIPDYCDPESGQCYGKALRGWTSPHLPESGPQAWSTAQAIFCVSRLRQTIQSLMHDDVLREFGGKPLSLEGASPKAWDRLLDTDLGNPQKDSCRTLKCVLEERVLCPFADSVSNPSYGAAYSAILFGPPGTAKTTICEALAERLGWDFLVVDTSVFLADGLSNVASRIRYVFERLQALEKCVILFDEIEEFCLNRETPGLAMESRMLTTSMLTALNDLRRTKRSIFFIATNRLRAFDSAITRPGRFDLQLFVGTPNLEARVIMLRQSLSAVSRPDTEKKSAIEAYRSFLESVWSEDLMFMNYLEGKQYATACANIVASGRPLTYEEMERILRTQAAVMTVRGQVRDDYLASMNLSRL